MKLLPGVFMLFWCAVTCGAQAPPESPFACDRLTLSPAARARHFDEIGPQLRTMRIGVREMPDGYAFQFPGDPKSIQLVAEWAAGERACCPFFDIALTMDREGGAFWMKLTGRPGTKQFIQADAAAWLTPVVRK